MAHRQLPVRLSAAAIGLAVVGVALTAAAAPPHAASLSPAATASAGRAALGASHNAPVTTTAGRPGTATTALPGTLTPTPSPDSGAGTWSARPGGSATSPTGRSATATSPGAARTATTAPAARTTSQNPPSAPASSATDDCGGQSPVKSTGGRWVCTFDDEFNGTALDRSKWIPQQTSNSGFHSGPECFLDSPNNLSVSGGTLRLTVRAEAAPFTCQSPAGDYTTRYTSGMVSTWGLFTQAYGRFEVRAKVPAVAVKGLQESFWLWPADATRYGAWPGSGEIDIAEIYHQYPDRAIPFIHYVPATQDDNVTNNYCMIADISQFHTYTVEWTPTAITIVYDGQTCLVDHWDPAAPLVRPQPFDQPFLVALTQALGIGTNAFDPATTPLPATTQIDYVRVWK